MKKDGDLPRPSAFYPKIDKQTLHVSKGSKSIFIKQVLAL